MLEHHHQDAPAREGTGRVDHLDATGEPLVGGLVQQSGEASRRRFQPGQPGGLVVWVELCRRGNPSLASVGAGEVQTRAPDVADDLPDAPPRFPADRRRPPRRRRGWERSDVALGALPHAIEKAQI